MIEDIEVNYFLYEEKLQKELNKFKYKYFLKFNIYVNF